MKRLWCWLFHSWGPCGIGGMELVLWCPRCRRIKGAPQRRNVTGKEYSSPRFAFMLRRLIGTGDDVYLDRLYIVQTPWFGIMFHRIYRPDRQRDLHDHPWNFLSIILFGSYLEDTPDGPKRHRWFNFKRAEDRHSIREVSRSPVWTLVFTGRKRRAWGFWVDGGTRWVRWTEYDKVDEP